MFTNMVRSRIGLHAIDAEKNVNSDQLRDLVEFPYIYTWGNNPVRARYKGIRCRIVCSLKMNSVVLEFPDGSGMVTSRFSIRRSMF